MPFGSPEAASVSAGFHLKPANFFTVNPALDIPNEVLKFRTPFMPQQIYVLDFTDQYSRQRLLFWCRLGDLRMLISYPDLDGRKE